MPFELCTKQARRDAENVGLSPLPSKLMCSPNQLQEMTPSQKQFGFVGERRQENGPVTHDLKMATIQVNPRAVSLRALSHLPCLVRLKRTPERLPPWCGSFGEV